MFITEYYDMKTWKFNIFLTIMNGLNNKNPFI